MHDWGVEQGDWRQQAVATENHPLAATLSAAPEYVAEAQAAFGVPAELGDISERAALLDQRGSKLSEVSAYGGMVVAKVEHTTRRARLAAASMITGTLR